MEKTFIVRIEVGEESGVDHAKALEDGLWDLYAHLPRKQIKVREIKSESEYKIKD